MTQSLLSTAFKGIMSLPLHNKEMKTSSDGTFLYEGGMLHIIYAYLAPLPISSINMQIASVTSAYADFGYGEAAAAPIRSHMNDDGTRPIVTYTIGMKIKRNQPPKILV